MDHADARQLISDWARGRLDASRAQEVAEHTKSCADCTAAAEAVARLEAEGRRLATGVSPHPSPETLARYVALPGESSTLELASVGVHLRECATCREDVDLVRAAAAPEWWRAVQSWLASPPASMRGLQPALAAAVVLLAYPAWLGLVEYPRARAAAERPASQAGPAPVAGAGARANPEAAAPRGSGVSALVLRGATRGGDDLPVLWLRPGQLLQPVLVDATLTGSQVAVSIVREPGGGVWDTRGPREEFWDPVNSLFGILVPAAVLTPGQYRLELAAGPGAPPEVTARFRVVLAPGEPAAR